MAIWTAQRDGNWSDDAANASSPWNGGGNPASGIPASGDTVNISNKTVTFDVDQSGFASGLASLTFAGGTLQASTSAGSYYLKMAGHITASAGSSYIKAGSSGTAYPSNCVFTIYLNGNYQINCNSSNYLTLELYCYEPVVKYAQLISATSKAITSITRGATTTVGCTGHGYSVGNTIYLANVGGTTELNNQFFEVATVPGVDSFTIRWPESDLAVDSTNFTAWTSGGLVCPQTAEAVAATQIEIDQNVSADAEWNRAGATVRIDNVNRNNQSEAYTISATTSTYLTLSSGLTNAKYSGSLAILTSRNIKIIGNTGNIITYGNGHNLGCAISSTSGSILMVSNAINPVLSGAMTGGNLGFAFCTNPTLSGVATAVFEPFYSCTNGTMSGLVSGCAYIFDGCSGITVSGLISGCNTIIFGSNGMIATGTIKNSVYGAAYGNAGSNGCIFTGNIFNCTRALFNVSGCYFSGIINNCNLGISASASTVVSNATIRGCSSGIYGGSASLSNVTLTANTQDLNRVSELTSINSLFGSSTEFASYNGTTQTIFFYAESADHDQVAGAYKAWTKGGIVTKQSTTYPTGYTYSYDHALESATAYCFWQQAVTVPAGGGLVVECLIRKDASMSYLPRLWLLLPGVEPLISGSPSYESIMTNSVDTWETLLLVYANATTADVQITVRTIGQNATDHVYALPIVTVLAPATYDVYSTLQADLDDIQSRIPATLVGGRMDSYTSAMATDSLTAAALSAGAVAEIQAGLSTLTLSDIMDYLIETGLAFDDAIKLIASSVAGVLGGAGTNTVTINNAVANDKTRITATVDSVGNRTAITYDLS